MNLSQVLPTAQKRHDQPMVHNPLDSLPGRKNGQKPATLELISRLCRALQAEQIAYCHWKSNEALDLSASGDNDLDLLVSRADTQRFTEILVRLGFKEARVSPDKQLPGVLDYHGYDQDADKLVHVHAHYQLILGHDSTKNYCLPLEKPYLESAAQGALFKVPAPEFELIVFVIRMVLKHSTWDTILLRHGSLSDAERREFAYLNVQVDRFRVYEILWEYLPEVDASLFDKCTQALQPGSSLWRRIDSGQRLQQALAAHARRAQPHDIGLKLWRRVHWGIRRRFLKRKSKKRLTAGGAMIAIVGGDGAGKSTAIDELHTWLAQDFDVLTTHLGKPAWSWTTTGVRGVLKVGRALGLYPFLDTSTILYGGDAPSLGSVPGYYPMLIRELCTARDRFLAYTRARRFAANGGLVISDRFPLSQIKLMDGALIEQLVAKDQKNWIIERLITLENGYYRLLKEPNLLIVLRLDPEIAVQRKTSEDARYVRTRSQEIWTGDWRETGAHMIDASLPKEAVASIVKTLLWSKL